MPNLHWKMTSDSGCLHWPMAASLWEQSSIPMAPGLSMLHCYPAPVIQWGRRIHLMTSSIHMNSTLKSAPSLVSYFIFFIPSLRKSYSYIQWNESKLFKYFTQYVNVSGWDSSLLIQCAKWVGYDTLIYMSINMTSYRLVYHNLLI